MKKLAKLRKMTPFLSADNTYISDEIQPIKNEKSSLRIRSKQNTSLNMNFNLISAGGGGGWNPPPSRFSPRHRHKNQPIDSKLSDFYFLPSKHNLTKNQVHNLSGGHVITFLSEALCFTTYLSLYFHRIFMFYFFFFLTFIFSVN